MKLKQPKTNKKKLHYVECIFEGRTRPYRFKTILELSLGDKVVAEVQGSRLKQVKVISNVDHDGSFECNWIVGKIDKEKMRKNHYNFWKTPLLLIDLPVSI